MYSTLWFIYYDNEQLLNYLQGAHCGSQSKAMSYVILFITASVRILLYPVYNIPYFNALFTNASFSRLCNVHVSLAVSGSCLVKERVPVVHRARASSIWWNHHSQEFNAKRIVCESFYSFYAKKYNRLPV